MKIAIDTTDWEARRSAKVIRTFTAIPDDVDAPSEYHFTLPGRSEVIIALVTDEGAKIDIQPERSASHRALRDALQS